MGKKKEKIAAKLKVGEQLAINDESLLTIKEAESKIVQSQISLGAHRENFLKVEVELISSIAKAREDYVELIKTIGRANGLLLEEGEESYDFNAGTGVFIRSK